MGHHGVQFDSFWQYPKPLQQPHPPIAARSIMRLPVADEATVLRALDHYARL